MGKIWGYLSAGLGFLVTVMYALLQREKKKSAEQALEDEKLAREVANNATEALVKGLENEQDEADPRKYKFNSRK